MSAAMIEQMIDDVLRREGSTFVNHPADKGGPTRHGITQATLGRHLGRRATADEVRDLSEDVARAIYRRDYYERPHIDLLPARVQPMLFDAAVNHGPRRAIRFLQRVCNDIGFGPLVEDGVCGQRTRASAATADHVWGAELVARLVKVRKDFCRQIVDRDPSQAVFLAGWLNRVAEFA